MTDLVKRLGTPQPVVIGTRLDDRLDDLRGQIERGYVFVKFTETRGGTELGVRIEADRSDLSAAQTGEGVIKVVGRLVLDYVPVRVYANISVPALDGEGHLEIVEE